MGKKTINDLFILTATFSKDVVEIKELINIIIKAGGIKTPVQKKLKTSEIKRPKLTRNSKNRVSL